MENKNLKKWAVVSNLGTLHFSESDAVVPIWYAEVALRPGIINAEIHYNDMGVPK
jgi:hypothetical protein